jgi:hypothetical protein
MHVWIYLNFVLKSDFIDALIVNIISLWTYGYLNFASKSDFIVALNANLMTLFWFSQKTNSCTKVIKNVYTCMPRVWYESTAKHMLQAKTSQHKSYKNIAYAHLHILPLEYFNNIVALSSLWIVATIGHYRASCHWRDDNRGKLECTSYKLALLISDQIIAIIGAPVSACEIWTWLNGQPSQTGPNLYADTFSFPRDVAIKTIVEGTRTCIDNLI